MHILFLSLLLSIISAVPSQAKPSARALPNSGIYSISIHGVHKGESGFKISENGSIEINGVTGPQNSWYASETITNGSVTSAEITTTGTASARYQYKVFGNSVRRTSVDAPGNLDVVENAVGSPAFFYSHAPILLQKILSSYPAGILGKSQALNSIDFETGKTRIVLAELCSVSDKVVHSKSIRTKTWRMISAPGPEVVVITTDGNLPLFWWAPSIEYQMVLAGYEELTPSAAFEKTVSQPTFAITVEHDVTVTMRDGLKLMADVYRPSPEGKYPVLLQRTCYDRSEFGDADGEFYAQRGYVYVTQHVRGRGNSEGEFKPYLQETEDGSDSIAWCAIQKWSSGKVGMLGAAYNAYCEWMALKTKPTALKAMVSTGAMPGPPYGAPWAGGPIYVSEMLSWYGLLNDKAKVQPSALDITSAMNTLPIFLADKVLFGEHNTSFQYWIDRLQYDSSVKQGSYREDVGSVDIPVLHVGGWLDSVGIGTRLNYMQMVDGGSKNQKLIFGPWNHFINMQSAVGNWDFGPEAYIDLRVTYLRWFDRWLKGIQNGIDKEPLVSTYLLNERKWDQSKTWPSESVEMQRWYLHTSAGTPTGGAISTKAPIAGNEKRDQYIYDPGQYIYSKSNHVSFFSGGQSGLDLQQLCLSLNNDRLVYQSEVLKQPMRLCGPVVARLSAASSAVDTDWVMALLDVSPGGQALCLSTGVTRARFQDGTTGPPKLLDQDQTYSYAIDMWQTGVIIPAGHRLRVVVLSTLFPDTDRNLNTGGSPSHGNGIVSARQTIYHEVGKLSYIVLPVLMSENKN